MIIKQTSRRRGVNAPRLSFPNIEESVEEEMLNTMQSDRSPLVLKSAFLMLLGSLLLGFVITRSIYIYQKYNSVLDEVVIEAEVDVPALETEPFLVLDQSSAIIASEEVHQVQSEVQNYVYNRLEGDDGEIASFFKRVPNRIVIPSINLDAKIEFASVRDVTVFGEKYQQWVAPSDAVGWHFRSALLGEPGNTVLNGHHNVNGEVFKDLFQLKVGDEIKIRSELGIYYYQVASVMILPERFESREVRLQNARWIQESDDERITLISCWPYESNTHRVVVVAFPIDHPDKTGGGQ